MISNSINVCADAVCRVPITGLSSPSLPLLLYEVDVLEHDGHEVAAAAADVDGEVPDAELPVQHNPLLRGAQPVRHLQFSVPLIRFESYLKVI